MNQPIYINLYRSGVYHRQGKPETANLHGGDVYVTEQAALENAEPDRGYITTIRAEVALPDGVVLYVNPPGSVPTPLSATQRRPETLLPWTKAADTSEAETSLTYDEWRSSPASLYKPAHGGYPDSPVAAKARALARA